MGGYNEQQAHSAKGGATRLSLLGELAVILSTVKGLVGLDLDVASLLLRCRDFLNMSVPFLLVTEAVLGQMAHDTTALLSTRKWPIHSANCQGVLRERESVRKMSVLDLSPICTDFNSQKTGTHILGGVHVPELVVLAVLHGHQNGAMLQLLGSLSSLAHRLKYWRGFNFRVT